MLALTVVLISGFCGRASDATGSVVWIKDTTHDTSSWPSGFAHIPQPTAESDLVTINGSAETSSDTAFDAVMRSRAGAFTTVYLGPGLFKTRGAAGSAYSQSDSPGFRLQDHARLVGSGKGGYRNNGTTLILVACNEYHGGLVVGSNQFDYWSDDGARYTTASDIWVTDLEVDCNAPELTKVPGSSGPDFDPTYPWYIQGVQLWGTGGCHIERVHVKNAVGADNVEPITENFILCINSPPGTSTGNVIQDCSVTDFYNPTGAGYCSAISMNRWDENAGSIQGIISGCDVVLNGERGWGYGGEFAYNASSAWGLVITNCISRGAQRGFNNDTFPNYFLSMTGNYFEMPPGVCYGMALIEDNYWSRFYDNTIVLKSSGSSGFVIARGGLEENYMLLDNNTVIADGDIWKDVSWSYNLNVGYRPELIPVKVHLENNKVVNTGSSARLVTLVPPSVGYMSGNNVNEAASLWPVPQPNLGWTYSPYRADLLSDGTVDMLLQDSSETIYSYSLLGATAQLPTTTSPSRPLERGWRVVGAGDINLDGKTDLFLDHSDHGLGYWLLDGTVCVGAGAITYNGQPCVLEGTWKVVGVADFNGDGKPDLLLQDDSTYLGVWHLSGTEVIDMALLSRNYSGGLSTKKGGKKAAGTQGKWRAVSTGDFDGDAKTDILFQYDFESDFKTDGQLAVWFMDDVTVVGTAMLDPVRPKDLKNRVVATGDFNRVSAVDILFQRKESRQGWGGALTLWSMDPVNRIHRLAESGVNSGTPVNVGSLNVVGPR